MKQRVSLITLGVADLERSRRFYEALGLSSGAEPGDDVVFFQAGEMIRPLGPRQAGRGRSVEDGGGWGGATLALNLGSPAEVGARLSWF